MPPSNANLPPGLGIPGAIQDKFAKLDQQAPFRRAGQNQYGPSVKTIGKGSLVQFNYSFWRHDPYPLVIVTDIYQGHMRGLNLHYLTFPYVKKILQPNCDNKGFSYYNIKGDQYIVNAFRTYKRGGIRQLKVMDCAFILNILGSVRSLDPAEIENIRKVVQEQIRNRAQPKAEEMSQQYTQMLRGQADQGFVNRNPAPVVKPE